MQLKAKKAMATTFLCSTFKEGFRLSLLIAERSEEKESKRIHFISLIDLINKAFIFK